MSQASDHLNEMLGRTRKQLEDYRESLKGKVRSDIRRESDKSEVERLERICRCLEVAVANTPPEVTKIEYTPSDLRFYTAYAGWDGTIVSITPPRNRHGLFEYLHECAHFALGHVDVKNRCRNLDKEPHLQEQEACLWAVEKMKDADIPIHPNDMKLAMMPLEDFKKWRKGPLTPEDYMQE